MTRCLKLNNPGSIRLSSLHWYGKVYPGRDAEFETFDSIEHGIRAIAVILLDYFHIHKLNTITQIISRWAPPTENDTNSYICDVCDRTGFEAYAHLDLYDSDDLHALVYAIIDHEQGAAADQVTDNQIAAGVANALDTHVLT